MSNRIRIRRDTSTAWTAANPVLALGEMGLETDTRKTKFGNGLSAWNSLPYSVDKSQIGLSNVDNTSDANKPISSATQSALDLKANSSDVYTKTQSDSNFESKNANIQSHISNLSNPHNVTKAQVGLSNVNNTSDADKPISTSTQSALDLKADASSVYTKSESDSNFEAKNSNIQSHISSTSNPHNVTKVQVGLGNVDNTSDANKPISIATQSALDLKANSSDVYSKLEVFTKTESNANFESKNANIQLHISNNSNPHNVTKAQIGLGNVDNTSDINKPISTATQSALNLKANSADVYTKTEVDNLATNTLDFANNYTDTKVAAVVNSAPTTLDTLNELATALGNDPNFATTTANLIGTKANSSDVYTKTQSDNNFEPKNTNIQSHIADLSNPHSVTAAQVGLGNVDNTNDLDKPVSTATQNALNEKVTKTGDTMTGNLILDFSAGGITSTITMSDDDILMSRQDPSSPTDFATELTAGNVSVYDNITGANTSINASSIFLYDDLGGSAHLPTVPAEVTTKKYVDNELSSKESLSNKSTDTTLSSYSNTLYPTEYAVKTYTDSNFEPKNTNIQSHISSLANPHAVTKAQVGLGNVDNISAASLRDRSTHTGTQLASTISDFTTAVQAVTIDASKIDGGNVSNLEFSYLDGVTSSIQTQINSKQATITGAATSITSTDLSAARALVSDSSGKVATSAVTATEIGYVSGVTSAIQTQLNGKEPTITAGTSAQYYRGDKTFQTLDKTAVGLSNVDNISAANLRDRTTHTGNESTLTFSETAIPSAPAAGATISSQPYGKQMFGQIGKAGRAYPFQPHLGQANTMIWLPNANATTSTVLGQVAPTAGGTATARTVAVTNSFTWQRRVGYVSAATAGSASGLRSSVLQVGLSNTANTGGFFFQTRFGVSDGAIVSGCRCFVGLSTTTAAFANVDPSTLLNIIGMGHDAADSNFQIMYNDGAGVATKVDLGVNFPIYPANTNMYDFILYAAPNSTTVFYQVMNMRTGALTSGSFNTNIPAVNTLLTWQHWRNNGTTAAAVSIDIASVYLETEF